MPFSLLLSLIFRVAQAQQPATPPLQDVRDVCECPGAAFLPTGMIFLATIHESIYSYNLLAPVVAEIDQDVKFKNRVVLPKRTRLVGTASTIHTLDRVNISFNLAVLPDGCEFQFSGIALMPDDGSAAIKGKLETHKGSIAAQIALKSLISGAASAASVAAPIEGSVATSIANEANQTISEDITKVKSHESVYVQPTDIKVFVLKRFIREKTSQQTEGR